VYNSPPLTLFPLIPSFLSKFFHMKSICFSILTFFTPFLLPLLINISNQISHIYKDFYLVLSFFFFFFFFLVFTLSQVFFFCFTIFVLRINSVLLFIIENKDKKLAWFCFHMRSYPFMMFNIFFITIHYPLFNYYYFFFQLFFF
jgi:hypothetical protein